MNFDIVNKAFIDSKGMLTWNVFSLEYAVFTSGISCLGVWPKADVKICTLNWKFCFIFVFGCAWLRVLTTFQDRLKAVLTVSKCL